MMGVAADRTRPDETMHTRRLAERFQAADAPVKAPHVPDSNGSLRSIKA